MLESRTNLNLDDASKESMPKEREVKSTKRARKLAHSCTDQMWASVPSYMSTSVCVCVRAQTLRLHVCRRLHSQNGPYSRWNEGRKGSKTVDCRFQVSSGVEFRLEYFLPLRPQILEVAIR